MTSTINSRVDGTSSTLAIKAPCIVATTANITLLGLQSIDGVTVAADDRVLVKDQTTASENGIYLASATAWTRAGDFDGTRDVAQGTMVRVVQGSTLAGSTWEVSNTGTITIGTTSLTFGRVDFSVSDAELAAIAGLTSAADRVPYFTGSGSAALATLTSLARTLLDDSTTALMKQTMDVESKGANIATATALAVNIAGVYHAVTGTTTVTSFANYFTGAYKELTHSQQATFEHSSSLMIPGAVDFIAQSGDISAWRQTSSGVWQQLWVSRYNRIMPEDYISGLTLANSSVDATNDITIAAGECMDSTNSVPLKISATLTKQLDTTWVATNTGTTGGLSSSLSAPVNDTWYHVFVGNAPSVTSNTIVGFDTDVNAANLIADHGVDKFRRIGSIYYTSSAIKTFYQNGDVFMWDVPGSASAAVGSTRVLFTGLSPPAVKCEARVMFRYYYPGTAFAYCQDPAITDAAPSASAFDASTVTSGDYNIQELRVWTNTSSQVAVRATQTDAGCQVITKGWRDLRGTK